MCPKKMGEEAKSLSYKELVDFLLIFQGVCETYYTVANG